MRMRFWLHLAWLLHSGRLQLVDRGDVHAAGSCQPTRYILTFTSLLPTMCEIRVMAQRLMFQIFKALRKHSWHAW